MASRSGAAGAAASSEPNTNSFKQQKFAVWQPLLTPMMVIVITFVVGFVFMILGSVALDASHKAIQFEIAPYHKELDSLLPIYDDIVQVTIPETMKAPVYFYYKISNFYQNHRLFVGSRADGQLRGLSSSTATCSPLEKTVKNGSSFTLYPCGLIASSVFNDTFTLCPGHVSRCHNDAIWQKQGIAWKSDREDKFIKRAMDPKTETNVGPFGKIKDVDDEDLIVWMRTASTPTFFKLYRIINFDLVAGSKYTIGINNTWPVGSFGGTKSLMFSTMTWMGGKNDFLGGAYLLLGFVLMGLAGAFLLIHRTSPRKLGDLSYFGWQRPKK